MPKRYKSKSITEQSTFQATERGLLTHKPVAVYYRQSTEGQIGNMSTSMQTVDMVDHLKRLGWSDDNIIMIDMDAGISGKTTINERPGMSQLYNLIVDRVVGTVACQDEDRLFRDVTQIQVNIFIEACRRSDVRVLTPSVMYDFAHPNMGKFYIQQFRFKCDMGAEYLNAYIQNRLKPARRKIILEGRWAGSGVLPGYMIDVRKTLPDGTKNENWRRYEIFEPYAEVIREYFRIFLELGGNTRATTRYIFENGPYFPDPAECLPPQGFRFVNRMKPQQNGKFFPSRNNLVGLLTNVVYIGHWTYGNEVVRWNNHPPLVDLETFMSAYNFLSDVTFDGKPNPDYRPAYPSERPSVDRMRQVERPLCDGLVYTFIDGKWRQVGSHWVKPLEHYAYTVFKRGDFEHKYAWSKAAIFFDKYVVTLLRNKLLTTFASEVWEEAIESFTATQHEAQRQKLKEIKAVAAAMESLIMSLEKLTNNTMIAHVQARYEEKQAEFERLHDELAVIEVQAKYMDQLYVLRESCGPALENWDHMTRTEKRAVLMAFVTRIEATPLEDNALEVVLRWRDGTNDVVEIPRQSTTGIEWRLSEVKLLEELINWRASQIEIASCFPNRKWYNIRGKSWAMWGNGITYLPEKPIKDDETYEDYLRRRKYAQDQDRAGLGKWRSAETELLLKLLEQGATQLEIAEALPSRAWDRIQAKIRKLKGKGYIVPGHGELGKYETIADYRARKAASEGLEQEENAGSGEDSIENMTSGIPFKKRIPL